MGAIYRGRAEGPGNRVLSPPWIKAMCPERRYPVRALDMAFTGHSRRCGVRRRERTVARRKMCLGCEQRRARFCYRGKVKADRFHTLCFCCFRALQDACRAWLLATQSAA